MNHLTEPELVALTLVILAAIGCLAFIVWVVHKENMRDGPVDNDDVGDVGVGQGTSADVGPRSHSTPRPPSAPPASRCSVPGCRIRKQHSHVADLIRRMRGK